MCPHTYFVVRASLPPSWSCRYSYNTSQPDAFDVLLCVVRCHTPALSSFCCESSIFPNAEDGDGGLQFLLLFLSICIVNVRRTMSGAPEIFGAMADVEWSNNQKLFSEKVITLSALHGLIRNRTFLYIHLRMWVARNPRVEQAFKAVP